MNPLTLAEFSSSVEDYSSVRRTMKLTMFTGYFSLCGLHNRVICGNFSNVIKKSRSLFAGGPAMIRAHCESTRHIRNEGNGKYAPLSMSLVSIQDLKEDEQSCSSGSSFQKLERA